MCIREMWSDGGHGLAGQFLVNVLRRERAIHHVLHIIGQPMWRSDASNPGWMFMSNWPWRLAGALCAVFGRLVWESRAYLILRLHIGKQTGTSIATAATCSH